MFDDVADANRHCGAELRKGKKQAIPICNWEQRGMMLSARAQHRGVDNPVTPEPGGRAVAREKLDGGRWMFR